MHEMSRRLATIDAMGRDAAMARFAEEDAEWAEQHARLKELAGWAPGPELAEALVAVANDAPGLLVAGGADRAVGPDGCVGRGAVDARVRECAG